MAAGFLVWWWLLIGLTAGFIWWFAPVALLPLAPVALHVRLRPERPVVTLGIVAAALVLTMLGLVVAAAITATADVCGTSTAAGAVEWPGAAVLFLGLGAYGLRRPRRLWTLPLGLVLAGVWIAAVAHLFPNGTGACFD